MILILAQYLTELAITINLILLRSQLYSQFAKVTSYEWLTINIT
jgi:hypothetical protein